MSVSVKVCLLELWGLGDAIMMTPMLQALRLAGCPTTVVCKPGTASLLRPSYPEVEFLLLDAPWTAFRGKYRLWKWPWRRLFRMGWTLRKKKFALMASVRRDPRDHFLMRLVGVGRRVGFPSAVAKLALTDLLPEPELPRPVAADWMALQAHLFPSQPSLPPRLDAHAYLEIPIAHGIKPVIGLHAGARIPVRRWPETKFRELFVRLRESYDFEFVLMPDLDGYGLALSDLADTVRSGLTIEEMVGAISCCDLLICNDSAPAHIADALQVPVVAIFGPTHPVRFRPFHARNLVVIRDLCAYRPCFDYCRFPEPKCLTGLDPTSIWPEIHGHMETLIKQGILPSRLRRAPSA